MPKPADTFNPLRPTLIRVAYRMLGSVTDAEDIVQEAFIRWAAPIATPSANPRRSCAGSLRACASIN